MRRFMHVTVTLLLLCGLGGCDGVTISLPSNTVTVTLVNASSAPVDVEIYISDEQDLIADLLTAIEDPIEVTVPPNSTSTPVSRRCEDFQAIVVEAEARVLPGISPSEDSDILRDGDEFGCGDTIVFTFTLPNPGDLNISVNAR